MLTPNSRNIHDLALSVGGIDVPSGSVARGEVGYASHQRRNKERARHEENVRMFVDPNERGGGTYSEEEAVLVMRRRAEFRERNKRSPKGKK